MTLTLYMDHHVPLAITEGLRRRGVDVLIAYEDGASALEDDALLERATNLGRTLFTQDDDLLILARQRQEAGTPFSGVIYAHQRAITLGQAVRDLHVAATVMDPEEMRSRSSFSRSESLGAFARRRVSTRSGIGSAVGSPGGFAP